LGVNVAGDALVLDKLSLITITASGGITQGAAKAAPDARFVQQFSMLRCREYSAGRAPQGIQEVISRLAQKPFAPPRALRNGHAMTIWASLRPRRFRVLDQPSERREFETEPGAGPGLFGMTQDSYASFTLGGIAEARFRKPGTLMSGLDMCRAAAKLISGCIALAGDKKCSTPAGTHPWPRFRAERRVRQQMKQWMELLCGQRWHRTTGAIGRILIGRNCRSRA
jgi:hypothetical protein